MILVLGLGNPGQEYVKSRHNVGFSFIDCLSNKLNIKTIVNKAKKIESFETRIDNKKVLFVKPLTFMNNSGNILPHFSHDKIETLIVCVDNMDLNVGKARFKFGGSSAGHNGLKSIISNFGNDFYRLYIGVGRPQNDTISHVLSSPNKDDQSAIDNTIQRCADAMLLFIKTSDFQKAQQNVSV